MLWIVLLTAWTAITVVPHVGLWARVPVASAGGREAADYPTAGVQGIRYAYADYWLAYYITFVTDERIIVAATDSVRVREHNRIVDAHRDEAVLVSRRSLSRRPADCRRRVLCSP